MALFFKEWSYIVDAMGQGLQSMILRKGGISEEEDTFRLKGEKFFLMPTLFHQAEQMIKSDWLPLLNGSKYHPTNTTVSIEYYAEVVLYKNIDNLEMLHKLNQQHAWKEEVILERFNRWNKSVNMLVVQVYQLPQPFVLELLPEYGGCKSWLEADVEIEMLGTPVMNKAIKGTYF